MTQQARRIRKREDPFRTLVRYFVKRVFANDDEQGSGSTNLGVGAVLAILASPGAFASIFLMDKYSTLLQWFRGQKSFNPYRASIADEYFFVVLSMTITGLVMVLRWNRLLPDRRDFANLAILPIPIRNIFLANFTGLFGLALVFGIDVNAVSSFLFPVFVTVSDGSFSAFARIAIAHAAAVFSASLFSFFAVFALVGVLMAVLPSRLFRPVSVAVRMLLVVVLLSGFLSNLFLQLFAGRLPHLREVYMRWLPAYWFLGIYEKAAGLANARMSSLASEALTALLAAIAVAIAAYTLCYRRHFLRLAESLDLLGSARRGFRIPLPQVAAKRLFRSEFERGCHGFMWKVLLRSERHLMFAGGYLGIGLVMAAQTAADGALPALRQALPGNAWLAPAFILAFFAVTALRFAFDLPASFEANWAFRITTDDASARPDTIARRFLLWAILPWEVLVVGGVTAQRFGWVIAGEHVATLAIMTVLLIDAVLIGFHKIPFTCSKQLETRQLLLRISTCVLGVLVVVPMLAQFERWMLQQPARFAVLAALSAGAWYALRRHKRGMLPAEHTVIFEEQSSAALELLKLV
ncbi:MAG TPA: hypothetical protein VHU83_19870 [Bryobacteraceae bacterium]|jgi:hypothetical protein|nr:hypothetical protein [Bryobacteraceae bacterium]